MDIRQLKYFVAVANERNFTRASEVLHIAQPPLSRQIQLLEEELGVQLILRNSRPLRLTEAGRVFYEQALQIINRLDQLKTATRQIGLQQRETVSIGFVPSTLYGGLPMLMRKLRQNIELSDLALALGVQPGNRFNIDDLRYERIVIMTDADVDGAHIAALLITFFYRVMPETIRQGRVFMALPPLYRISAGPLSEYARDDAHREELLKTVFKGKKVEIGRFKGLGEMMASQLKETTMDPKKRTLARITVPDAESSIEDLVERLMGKRAEARFQFIQENARFAVEDLDV